MSKITKEDVVNNAVIFTSDQVIQAWGQSELSHLRLISTNKEYRALPKRVWDRILDLHLTAVNRYEAELFDCDSFSLVFSAFVAWDFDVNGVARVLDSSAHHSYNAVLIVSDDGKTCSWEKVEPQLDVFIGDSPPPGIKVEMYISNSGFAITT